MVDPADPAPTFGPAPDEPVKRLTRRQQTAATKAALEAQRSERIGREATIIASIVGGMSRRAVAAQLSIDERTVRRVWANHQAQWEDDAELRAELQTRYRTMVRAVWQTALASVDAQGRPLSDKAQLRQLRAMAEVRRITHEQALLGNLLHVQVDANVSGTVEHVERREVRVTVVREKLAGIRIGQLQRQTQAALPPAPQTNGHEPAAHNGSEAA